LAPRNETRSLPERPARKPPIGVRAALRWRTLPFGGFPLQNWAYRIIHQLGQAGSDVSILLTTTTLDRPVAIKVPEP